MRTILYLIESSINLQAIRYIVNGLVATTVHFIVLQANLKMLSSTSAGLANFIAAFFGISFSFLGGRYFVYKANDEPILNQLTKFGSLYATIAMLHGLVLYCWSDLKGWDFRTGFLLATLLQVACSYWGNRFIVFKK